MKKTLLQDIFERAKINNIRINHFIFMIEVYLDIVKYRFCYNFNYNDNVEENDFYTIADEIQSDDFEVSRVQFLKMIDEIEQMSCYSFRQLTKLHNFSFKKKYI